MKKIIVRLKWHKDAIENGGATVLSCIKYELQYTIWKLKKYITI